MTTELEPRFRELVERVLGDRIRLDFDDMAPAMKRSELFRLLSAAYAMDREGRGSKRSAFQLASTRQPPLDDLMSAAEAWRAAEQRRRDMIAAYNERLAFVRAERDRGDWGCKADLEYLAMEAAQRDEYAPREGLFAALSAPATHDGAPVSVTSLASPSEASTQSPTQETPHDQ